MNATASMASNTQLAQGIAICVIGQKPEEKLSASSNSRILIFVVLYRAIERPVFLVCVVQGALAIEPQACSGKYLKPLLPAHEEADLISLWARRSELGKPEWDRLWTLVTKVLGQCHPAVLRQLAGEHGEHVVDFFLNKVIQDKYTQTRLDSAAALATFFQRYLLDLVRYEARRPTTYLDDETTLDHLSETGDDNVASNMASAQSGPAESSHWKQLLGAASTFVHGLGHEDQIYLSLHACDDESEALYKIAAKYNIASYHYKAGQLGITRKKGELPEDFERTRIGIWLTKTLGLRVAAECAEDILEAFEALCEAAAAAREGLMVRLSHA
jgi:hypothetical protein